MNVLLKGREFCTIPQRNGAETAFAQTHFRRTDYKKSKS